jgi:hypothetical protein
VRAELDGFSSAENDRVELAGDTSRTIELHLTPAFAESVTVTSEAPLVDSSSTGTGATFSPSQRWGGERETPRRRAPAPPPGGDDFVFRQEAENLKAGLVGGVRPIPVVIPESGKALRLAGLFPPAQVTVTLETRPSRR